jgi:hypothetical protein
VNNHKHYLLVECCECGVKVGFQFEPLDTVHQTFLVPVMGAALGEEYECPGCMVSGIHNEIFGDSQPFSP